MGRDGGGDWCAVRRLQFTGMGACQAMTMPRRSGDTASDNTISSTTSSSSSGKCNRNSSSRRRQRRCWRQCGRRPRGHRRRGSSASHSSSIIVAAAAILRKLSGSAGHDLALQATGWRSSKGVCREPELNFHWVSAGTATSHNIPSAFEGTDWNGLGDSVQNTGMQPAAVLMLARSPD